MSLDSRRLTALFVVTAVTAAVASSRVRAQAVPPFTPLGVLDPGGTSDPRGITSDGSAVYGTARGAITDGFRWTRAGGIAPLGLGDLGVFGYVSGVSADGRAVVATRQIEGVPSEAFVSVDGAVTPLTPSPGYLDAHANVQGISGDGSVAVGWENGRHPGGESRLQAVRWTSGVAMPLEAGAAPFDFSLAYNVSRDGSVAVGAARIPGSTDRAFRWTAASGIQALPLPMGFTHSAAIAVSADNRTIVGSAIRDLDTPAEAYEAFRFVGGDVELLGDLPGGPHFSVAHAVSADGTIIVGRSAVGGTLPFGDDRAFIWDADHGMRDLAAVLTELGADLTGWTLTAARAISDDGHTIAGMAINRDGMQEGFVAVVPEPTAPGLVGGLACCGGLVRRRRRGATASLKPA